MPRQRRRILRERNERGLSLFLRTLNSVLRICISEDPFQNVCRNDLIDGQERLINALSTLALLVEDMSISNHAEIDWLNMNLRGRLIDLKKNVQGILEILSTIVERDEDATSDTAYYMQNRPSEETIIGRPLLAITGEQLEHLRSLHFSWQKIAKLLHVSISTIQRRRIDFEMEEHSYSDISNEELDSIYLALSNSNGNTIVTPNLG